MMKPTHALLKATLALHPSGYRETWARCASALEPLRRLSRTWAGDAVIHGDIKSDNILSDGSGVVIIDWETAGIGDAMWDLGCLVGDRVCPIRQTCVRRPDAREFGWGTTPEEHHHDHDIPERARRDS